MIFCARQKNRRYLSYIARCVATARALILENNRIFVSILTLCIILFANSGAMAGTLDETARFLAGKGVASDSKLAAYAQTKFYAEYAEETKVSWRRFQKPNLERMKKWWKKYAPRNYSTIFYPFGGPDIVNAITLFPDADTYLMFGLEPPGEMQDPETMQDESISAGLNDLKLSLNTFFQVNFFITKKMEKKLGRKSFNSITGLIMFLLAMNDCEVIDLKKIALGSVTLEPGTTEDDSIKWQNPPRSRVPGIEITFRRNSGKIQTARYFMLNIEDASLSKSSPNFIPYLKSMGRYATLLKSASYLLHTDSAKEPPPHFDQIREFILGQSDFILQDDSGVPLRFFARDKWKLLFHGKYDAPISLYSNRLQKNFKTEMQKNSTGRLPFSYSYNYQLGESNIMTAERIQ